MRPLAAWSLLALLAAATLAALLAPWPVAVALGLVALALMPRRGAFLLFALPALALNAALLQWIEPGAWREGLVGGARLVAAVGANLALLGRVGAARLADGLRLPPRATAWSAAVLLAAQDVGRDFARLKLAREVDGDWPRGRVARAREAARLLPALVVAAVRRATIRREALRLAGHDTPAAFVPIVAVAGLAAAGRLAFLALPNVALTYVVVFVGGVLFGAWVGAAGGALAMLVTDLALTGLYPPGLVNVPAMALLGLLGGALRRVDWSGSPGAVLAGAVGIAATFAFSVASDAATWLLLYADRPAALAPLVLVGLAFNVLPALVNGALFATGVGPCVRAFAAWRGARPPAPATPEPAPRAPREPDPSSSLPPSG